ncbi:fumarylacetoacetate hydrolase family protein [Streptomyces sp. LBUM 1478]|uniref:fumarylacetoacetate hydrolase family protein n=1 Tax=Streptomyces scabiei TaxID=1930 RepID=UPI000765B30D|nr:MULTISPECIES: fumarylacetoacetate hydrolase family protein [Streptomyces]MBP5910357.1 fumarylacetoacetate hydrolase family protein [Streptomyces sp. LBUM 1478]MBP5934195.1 fumarylacetoacetate hydrolase family protein [Streptomyces sp. LBUM 1479]MBP5896284.1 fumarylacetoacetate hydrolase family protein [Streptomyces sp. LBUM 1481]MBP5910917.1 fumarylacetoacetate hydrolase family protein [Streptomyces sp. LBUM 1486]MBP5926620.1 fumarylacetoacetate hydrolase family protein [Streptomyces sp. LB
MSTNVLRTPDGWWVLCGDRAVQVDTKAVTTAELIADRDAVREAARSADAGTPVADLAVLSPVTTPCRVVAQMVNYRSHARDSGFTGDIPPAFFRKASGSVSGPGEAVVRPSHVRFLDYEIELGLVMGAPLPVGTVVEERDLPAYVAGLVITNDVSAREIQLTRTQFYESKSYPTFTPTGPHLALLEPEDFAHLLDLRLQLSVNGELRQDRTLADMIVRPAQALTLLARFQTLDPGDLLLTGTPGGTALKAPPKPVEKIGALLPPALKWKSFFKTQARNPRYLHSGDVITATIATPDGRIDLGEQRTPVADPRQDPK